MEIFIQWIEKFIVLYLFLACFLYLIPRETYRKYIRFYTQLVLVITLCLPILSFVGKMKQIDYNKQYRSIVTEIQMREKEAEEMTYLDKKYISYGLGDQQ